MTPADWQPTGRWPELRRRAELLARIRAFFDQRDILEVDTPLLQDATIPDPQIESIRCDLPRDGRIRQGYLQTSPEFAMKRLLAAGSGPIFQICKAFRAEELGRVHSLEFTMLEWYRPGFDHHQLMDEMDALLIHSIGAQPAERLTYQQAFEQHLGIDPHRASPRDLESVARRAGIDVVGGLEDRDSWLHLLLSHAIEPHLGIDRPTFLLDFPASQAALARIRRDDPPVAERFEVYFQGMELANGFHELTDADEQRRRFRAELAERQRLGHAPVPLDEHLLAALASGLPACAGVALGIDRLAALHAGTDHIADVMCFGPPSRQS